MARYELRIKSSVSKDLRGVPKADMRRILNRIEALQDVPRPLGCEKLSAQERYRVRQGDYRIIYSVNDMDVIVEVVKVGHRRGEVARRLLGAGRKHAPKRDAVAELVEERAAES